jgi:hypothetical protein
MSELPDTIRIEVYQQDWMPGFAAFRDDDAIAQGKAHVALNVGALMACIAEGDIDRADLPYLVAESLMHEVINVLEAWAGVEFSEERVEALLDKYRAAAEQEPPQ